MILVVRTEPEAALLRLLVDAGVEIVVDAAMGGVPLTAFIDFVRAA